MPETTLKIQWPDRTEANYYSPSTVIHEYFKTGESYPVEEFLQLSRRAYQEASDRVQAKFGMACTGASSSLAQIESDAQLQSREELVVVL
ncbi:MAG: MSMEG_0570 family nitrogen starvation response protein [Planctomycetota bacterium]